MGYEKLKGCEGEEFRRLTGVKKTTYSKMVEILKEAEREKKSRGGKGPTTHAGIKRKEAAATEQHKFPNKVNTLSVMLNTEKWS